MSEHSKSQKIRNINYANVKKFITFKLRNAIRRPMYKYFQSQSDTMALTEVGSDKKSWEHLFLSLLEPVLQHMSDGKAQVKIYGPQISSHGKQSDYYEGFARSFVGVCFYLHGKKGEFSDIADVYRQGIVNGTNPEHPEYWGNIHSNQILVENNSVALGLLLVPEHFLDKFSDEEKLRLRDWYRQSVEKEFCENNWQWFKVFHYLLLAHLGDDVQEQIEETLMGIEEFYCGDGWYSDGRENGEHRFDYYVPWAMHFYGLLFAYMAGEQYPEWSERYKKRARKFFSDYQHFFTTGGVPPLYGRSQIYRFASLAPWGLALALDVFDGELAWLKQIAIDTVNTFIKKGMVRGDGILTMGHHKEFPDLSEKYSGPGSPYWAFKGFSFLLLPEDHVFWQTSAGGKRENKVHAIPTPCLLLTNNADGHTTLINAGSSNISDSVKYNKFAYSNIFLPNLNGLALDNMLLLRESAWSSWRERGRILSNFCEGDRCVLEWNPYRLDHVTVKTTIIAKPEGYTVTHELKTEQPIAFQLGGFALAQDEANIQQQLQGAELLLAGTQNSVGLKLLEGDAEMFVYEDAHANPAGKYSFVPGVKGKFSAQNDTIVVELWGRQQREVVSSREAC